MVMAAIPPKADESEKERTPFTNIKSIALILMLTGEQSLKIYRRR